MRLFEDDDPGPLASRVYLVTGTAVYKTFADADGDDVYEQATPRSRASPTPSRPS